MTVRLRAHHLLCMLTYVGEGYSRAFVENYDRIVARLNAGEDIEIVAGPDDVCAPLLADDGPHCLNASVVARDAAAARDLAARLRRPIEVGERLGVDRAMLAALHDGFRAGATRTACGDCQWSALCTEVAGRGFAGARLEA